MKWDWPKPFTQEICVTTQEIDALGHVNNAHYVRWMEDCAWQHSQSLGLGLAQYQSLNRAMAVIRHEVDYLASAYVDQQLIMGTWIREMDNKLKMDRYFQLIRPADNAVLLRAKTTFACIELSSGRPKRMPAEFIDGYSKALSE